MFTVLNKLSGQLRDILQNIYIGYYNHTPEFFYLMQQSNLIFYKSFAAVNNNSVLRNF